jgi:Cu/Ag efflux pump CusA
MLGRIKGVDAVNVELQTVVPQVEVEVDLAKAHQQGIKPGDVRRAAATVMGGEEVGDIFRDGRTYDVQVWSTPPPRHRAQVIGVYAERQAASRRLFGYAILTASGIFLILLYVLKRLRLAILSFMTLPIALVGGILGNYLAGGVLSIGSIVGLFTVLGIVSRNGIMMISHFQHLEDVEGMPFGPELVIRGARERIAPIMMTALTTALALVPLIVAGNIAGQEIEYPMGVVILGGLISSTVVNLFVVPSLYLRFAKSKKMRLATPAISATPTTP